MRFTDLLDKIDPMALARVTGGAHSYDWWRNFASNQGQDFDLLVRDLGPVRAKEYLRSK